MSEKLKPCPLCGNTAKIEQGSIVCSQCITCGIKLTIRRSLHAAIAHWNTRADEKILPIPCTKYQEATVKEWFQKINEELDELKEAIIRADDWTRPADEFNHHGADTVAIAEEAADVITVITSMLESMEIDEDMRQKAQKAVNAKNKERGRC